MESSEEYFDYIYRENISKIGCAYQERIGIRGIFIHTYIYRVYIGAFKVKCCTRRQLNISCQLMFGYILISNLRKNIAHTT